MRVLILGAGGIARGMAALLHFGGHQPLLWSPSGKGVVDLAQTDLQASGALQARFRVDLAYDLATAVKAAAVVVVALPANGHRRVMDLAIPHLTKEHCVIVSAQLSLGAAYLRQELVARSMDATVIGWGTTVVMGRQSAPGFVQIGGLRPAVPMAVLPSSRMDSALALCRTLFGDRFQPEPGLLAIALGNLNPPVHLANALCNLTRIENGETWFNYNGMTKSVARLILALDAERQSVAQAFGLSVRSVEDHFRMSFGLPDGMALAEMAAQIHQRRGGPPGPVTLDTRFITEDVPFGIVEIITLAAAAGVAVPLHQAGLALVDALYGTKFGEQNDLLPAVNLAALMG
ncbi:NAD/NADP octopine/nopaline dehydrogenase family protein [Paragemmobacter ruber]|uniref:2-dehydropantoate 2-reductase n=1 Tax=Paragemmobacter ruber TaxID=1985673 RepID=A0ABW9YA90_9RHOB|nr:NAD/NADP octopine/nopaline dehydrogenase family protein [Rhodobacter ruber]NBE09059.1 NAD/NADP octopine/nopaline dehydrogenase [Rhodobacter ruber]